MLVKMIYTCGRECKIENPSGRWGVPDNPDLGSKFVLNLAINKSRVLELPYVNTARVLAKLSYSTIGGVAEAIDTVEKRG